MTRAMAPKRMGREERRAALLNAAAMLLRNPSPATLTFEAVAEQAGVSPTLPYKYFESVDQMAKELYEGLIGSVDEQTNEILADANRTFDNKIRDTMLLWTGLLRRDGHLLLRLVDEIAHPSLVETVNERRERTVTVWAAEIRAEFNAPTATARVLAGSITAGSGAVLRRWVRDQLDTEAVIDLFVVMARAQIEAAVACPPPA